MSKQECPLDDDTMSQYEEECPQCGVQLHIAMPIAVMTKTTPSGQFVEDQTVCYQCRDDIEWSEGWEAD